LEGSISVLATGFISACVALSAVDIFWWRHRRESDLRRRWRARPSSPQRMVW
jgi:hypothetical protein